MTGSMASVGRGARDLFAFGRGGKQIAVSGVFQVRDPSRFVL